MSNSNELKRFGRRDFLRLTGSAVAMTTGNTLAGCGGGAGMQVTGGGQNGSSSSSSGGSTSSTGSMQNVTGIVSRSEISGTVLQVSSASQENAAVDPNGSFSTQTSDAGPQMLFARDSSGKIQGLGVVVPSGSRHSQKPNGRATTDITVDATSTTLAIIFMAPGILTTDGQEAQTRINQIQGLPSFGSLLGQVRAALPSKTVAAIVADATISASIQACVADWMSQYNRSTKSRQALVTTLDVTSKRSRLIYKSRDDHGISQVNINLKDETKPTDTQFDIFNVGWRCVKIQRRDIAEGIDPRVSLLVRALQGGSPLSWGSLFSLQVAKPTHAATAADFSVPNGATTVEYWISGPGYANGDEPPSENVDPDIVDTTAMTVLYYGIFPVLDLFTGSKHLPEEVKNKVETTWNAIKTGMDATGLVNSLTNASNDLERFGRAVDLLTSMLAVGLANDAFLKSGLISEGAAGILKKLFAVVDLGSKIFTVANVSALVLSWHDHAKMTKIAYSSTGNTPVSYISLSNASLSLYPWEGNHCVILSQEKKLDVGIMRRMLATFDAVFDYYAATTGKTPPLGRNLYGKLTIAEVQDTCGAGCSYIGATGIEIMPDFFNLLYTQVRDANQFDQVVFYEFGRNFWYYTDQIEYKGSDDTGSITTGFAVFMRFMAMDAAGVQGAPFHGSQVVPLATLRQDIVDLVDTFTGDSSYTWRNTLQIGRAPSNPLNLGGADMFASICFRLMRDYGGKRFVDKLWKEVDKRPAAVSTTDALHNFVAASSAAAGRDLTSLFRDQWRWPI